MTYKEFTKGMAGEQLAYAENLQAQRNDAIARIAASNQKLLDDHATEKAALAKERDAAKAMCEALGGTALGQKMAKEKQLADLHAAWLKAQQEADDAAKAIAAIA